MSRKQTAANSRERDFSKNDNELIAVPVDSLDGVSQLELFLTQFAEAGPAPKLTVKAIRFLQQHAKEIRDVLKSPKQTPEQWFEDLLAPLNGELLANAECTKSESLEALTKLWNQFGGVPGTIKQWFTLFTAAVDAIAPQELCEWEELARSVPNTDAMVDSSRALMIGMMQNLKPSIDAGLVSVDLAQIAEQDFPRAVALCYYWLTRFTALSVVAFPSPTDVNSFAQLCRITPPEANTLEELNLAIWLQQHPVWVGMLESLLGSRHPIVSLFTNDKRPHLDVTYLVEIDRNGVLQRLRNVVSTTQLNIPFPQTFTEEMGFSVVQSDRTIHRRGEKVAHIPPVRLSPALWKLFDELLKAGRNGTTPEFLTDQLSVKPGALNQRKNQLKNALFPLSITIPDGRFRLADF